VHGTFSENPSEFTGNRIIGCDTGDSPRGHGGGHATAIAGWAVESSQSEESTETATTGPLPGTVPAVADNGGNQVGWWMVNRARYGRQVHGTCSESLRDLTGMRIIGCDTGDSPRSRRQLGKSGGVVDGKQGLLRPSGAWQLQRESATHFGPTPPGCYGTHGTNGTDERRCNSTKSFMHQPHTSQRNPPPNAAANTPTEPRP